MCIFDYDFFLKNHTKHEISLKTNKILFNDLNNEDVFLVYACGGCSMWCCITKAAIVKTLKFDTSFINGEDQIFRWQLYNKINSFCYLKENLYMYRCVEGSASNKCLHDNWIYDRNKLYFKFIEIINKFNYNKITKKAANTQYIGRFWTIVNSIFKSNMKLNEKIGVYNNYISSPEFKESIKDFSDMYFSRITKLCLRNHKAPHWFFVYLLVKIRDLRNFFIKKEKF